ncbi:Do family serine endopeptidase [Maritalea mediterranea]|uniref:Probable periplasmic serine endoprotease DegP-like n=1 Tax=Maritalea mediterranea TaxID=2909667 RepID=A0ABS9E7W1_9HYPH|nr:Do family serine endopeptidase [Maritalea mediterranea]MCF4098893.1 Do family serine endopeptidase [Maritalea mediterranea]
MRLFELKLRTAARLALAVFFMAMLPFMAQGQGPVSFAPLVKELQPAVVNISTTRMATRRDLGFEFPELPENSPLMDLFERFQEPDFEHEEPLESRSLGSGFVIDAEGTIVTNYHVIEGATEIWASFVDGTRLRARILGVDQKTDIAVLKVESNRNLPAVRLGDSDAAEIGDWVMAIGNPFGLGGSISAGIVSARNRDINSGPYDNFIQTDAAINQGNSGGPLFNVDGEVVGINTAIISRTGGSLGIGFSIPINLAKPVIRQLIEFGETRRGWLGIGIQDVSEDIALSLGRPNNNGALVLSVDPEGPSFGILQEGDLILEFDGRQIERMRDLPRFVAETDVGKRVDVVVERRGQKEIFEIELGLLAQENPLADLQDMPMDQPPEGMDEMLGFEFEDLNPENRKKYGLGAETEGVLITLVLPQSDAEEKGIRAGHRVVEVNQQSIFTAAELRTLLGTAIETGREVILLKIADPIGNRRFVAIRLNK